MDSPAPYLHWFFILISASNLAVIILMLALLGLALLAPFPGHGGTRGRRER